MAYLYQYKARRIDFIYMGTYLLCFLLIFGVLINILSFDAFLLLVAVAFSTHFFFDEARLLENNASKVSLLLLLPPIFLFVGYLATNMFTVDVMPHLIAASVVVVLWTLYKNGAVLMAPHVWYVNSASIVFIALYLLDIVIMPEAVFGAIIVYHVGTWYVHFYKKLQEQKQQQRTYISECILINMLLIGGFFLHEYVLAPSFLGLIYDPVYYYGWAFLHIIFSSREIFALLKERVLNYFLNIRAV